MRSAVAFLALLLALAPCAVEARASANPRGWSFLRGQLRQIAKRTAQGKKTYVIFDIDNTLVDTRWRTRAAVKAWSHGVAPLHRIRYTGAATALGLGFGWKAARSFDAFWGRFFWKPSNFRHDRPIWSTINLARKAKAAGAEVIYVTGRDMNAKSATLEQLRNLGLPDVSADNVICKRPGEGTRPFKVREVRRLRKAGKVAWVLSDAPQEILDIRKHRLAPAVLVDALEQPNAPRIDPSIPRIRAFYDQDP